MAGQDRRNARLSLHIPEPPARDGEPSFAHMRIPPAGETPRPPVDAAASDMTDLAYQLVRVLDDDQRAVGPWDPRLDPELLRRGLRAMMLTRAYDDRMQRMQRQGKTSFFMKSAGEEAVAVAAALVLDDGDMCFPTYRQQGILIARDWPIIDMMNQVYSNSGDRLKGRQLPALYSSREAGFFSISGNLGTQLIQAVGWAMASALSGDSRIAATWTGEGASAEGDFHYALTFATIYRAPVIVNVVNNQWAISSSSAYAGGEATTFAARGIAYGLPALRVDGNDFLAVHAATRWAAERARSNLGATLIEMVTYRADAHSTSDDPSRYRARDEAARWPLGDPVDRLRRHLTVIGEWDDARHEALAKELVEQVRAAGREAEALGTLQSGAKPPRATLFEDIFKAPAPHHLAQRAEMETF